MEVAHIDAFRRDPDRFWSFYGAALRLAARQAARTAPTRWSPSSSGAGLVRGVITQNIDRLHRAAGSERLVEVHGSIEWSVCLECGGQVGLERVVELLEARPTARRSAPPASRR